MSNQASASSASAAARSAATRRNTAIGASAILLWGTLAVLTTFATAVPPFLMTAITFGIAALVGLGVYRLRGQALGPLLRQPLRVWGITVAGLFGYHMFLFVALRLAPAVEANLINYLWPLCIVLFSALLPGERLGWHHLLGAMLGLVGTVLIVGGGGVSLNLAYLPGYLFALAAAVTWGAYSVLSRRFCSGTPSDFVFAACGGTAVLAGLCHLAFETGVSLGAVDWAVLTALGLGPLGLAFLVWDIGCKRGDIQTLGAASYATPFLSTLLLMLAGKAQMTQTLAIAGLLIVGGAVLASKDLWARRR